MSEFSFQSLKLNLGKENVFRATATNPTVSKRNMFFTKGIMYKRSQNAFRYGSFIFNELLPAKPVLWIRLDKLFQGIQAKKMSSLVYKHII